MAVPGQLAGAIQSYLEGHGSQRAASGRLSETYRSGGTSAEIDFSAYLVARLPATYAAVAHVLAAIASLRPGFAPTSLLDVGSGPGTASWAATGQWPGLAHVQFLDSNREFLDLALRLAGASDNAALRGAAASCGDVAKAEPTASADLVIASYALAEIPDRNLATIYRKLWSATSQVLVLIEPGTPSGFARIRKARELLLNAGARPVAPCPHAHACPVAEPDWCHFSVRLPRSRAHMHAKGARVPFEDEKFSWAAFSREEGPVVSARILAPPAHSKVGVTLKLCTPQGLELRTVARRDGGLYKKVRKLGWGEAME
jgi:ribosomal protein RSM22 (predicted rRNA methylase)